MKIRINHKNFTIPIRFPTLLFCSFGSSVIISKNLKKIGVSVPVRAVYSSLRTLRKEIRKNRKLTIFTLETHDNVEVSVKL